MLEIERIITGELEENTYIVYKNGIGVVIDPGFDGEKILSFIKERGLDIKYIILTHSHFDHIGAAEFLKNKLGAEIICSEEEKELLESAELNLSAFYSGRIEITPDKTFSDGEKLTVGDMDFEFMLTPGHTKGSAVIFCEDSMFTGDTLFSDGYGRTDFPTGNWGDLMKSLRRLRGIEKNFKVYSGHGEESFLKRRQV